jgi:hypothetical protein
MNILEALKEMESGKIVRSQVGREISFFFNSTLLPYDSKILHRIEASEIEQDEKITSIKDLKEMFDDDFRICISYLRSENYSVVTESLMVEECEQIRAKNQEE